MIAYDPEPWHDLFFALMGATAALAGLIFVAVSLNSEQIIKYPRLPATAARAIATLIAIVLMSAFVLTPGQTSVAIGIEIAALGAVLTIGSIASSLRNGFDADMQASWRWQLLGAVVVSTAPMLIGGVSLAIGWGGGLYWGLGESVIGVVVSVYYAWILLIEIRR